MNINPTSPQQNTYVDYSHQQSTSIENTQRKSKQDTVAISDAGRSNPDYARTLAKDLAHSDFLMSVDVSTISEGGNIAVTRYTNGDLISSASTRASVQQWENEAKQYRKDNIDLYNTEKENGTSDVNIIMMLMEKNMNLPESFRTQQGSDYL